MNLPKRAAMFIMLIVLICFLALLRNRHDAPDLSSQAENQRLETNIAKLVSQVAPRVPVPNPIERTRVPAETSHTSASVPGLTGTLSKSETATEADLEISGHITLDDGAPAVAAKVALFGTTPKGDREIAATVTASDGSFHISARETTESVAGLLIASLEGYTSEVAMLPHNYALQSGTLARGSSRTLYQELTLYPPVSIDGVVVVDKGEPVAGARIFAKDAHGLYGYLELGIRSVRSGNDGSFHLSGIRTGEVELLTTSDEFGSTRTVVKAPAQDVVIRLGGGGAQIVGRVIMDETMQPVPGAGILLRRRHQEDSDELKTVADRNGFYIFEHLSAGAYELSASTGTLRSYVRGMEPLERSSASGLSRAPQTPLQIADNESTRAPDLVLFSGHAICGKVTAFDDGRPLPAVQIRVLAIGGPTSFTVTSRSDGSYILPGLFEADIPRVAVEVSKPGYVREDGFYHNVELPPDNRIAIVDVKMRKAVPVSGIVRDAGGKPVNGANVALIGLGQVSRTTSNVDGSFALDAAPASSYTLSARSSGGAYVFQNVTVANEPVSGIILRLL